MFYRRKINKLKKKITAIEKIVVANNEFLSVIYEALTEVSEKEDTKEVKGFLKKD